MSEKDQVVEILRKAISPPFKATMGDGAGNVVVTGRPGYVWCRKVGRSEVLMQAYNRGAPAIEDVIVLVQQSRTEHLGYEVIGVASGASPDNIFPPLPPHNWTHEWRPGIGRDRVTVYPRSWGYLRAEPIETGSLVVWVTPGWLYYDDEYIWYPGGYSPAFGAPAGPSWYQTLYMDPSDRSLHIIDGVTGGYGYAGIPVPSGCMLPIAAVESTGTFGSVTENMIEDIRLFMDPIEDCGTGTALGAIEIEEDDVWVLDATILNFEGGGGRVTDEGGGKATIDISDPTGVSYCNIQWHVDGPLQTGTEVGEARLAPPGFDMLGAWMYCKNPGSAGNTIVDINKNDVTVFTVQANRPTLPWNDPDNKIKGGALGVTTLVEGDKLSMDIDGVATGVEDLDVLLILGATGTGPAGLGLIEIQEDDAKIADASIVNFEGGGGKVTDEGSGKVTVDITGGGGVTDAEYIVTKADAGLSAEVVIPGLAASPDISPAAPAAQDDEFDAAALDPKWTKTSDAAADDIDTTWPSHVFAKFTGDQGYNLSQAYAPAGAFTIAAKFRLAPQASWQGAYMYIYDNDESDGIRLDYKFGPNFGVSRKDANVWTYDFATLTISIQNEVYLLIQRGASDDWTFWGSFDGLSWWRIGTHTKAFTVHHFEIELEQTGSTIPVRVGIDWVRRDWLTP